MGKISVNDFVVREELFKNLKKEGFINT